MFAFKEKDSRSESISEDSSVYITSEPADDNWGQPPASKYVFWIEGGKIRGTLLSGIYVSQLFPEEIYAGSTLVEEFETWDLLSDEALLNFEENLE